MKYTFVLVILICVSIVDAAHADRPLDLSDPFAQYHLAHEYAQPKKEMTAYELGEVMGDIVKNTLAL